MGEWRWGSLSLFYPIHTIQHSISPMVLLVVMILFTHNHQFYSIEDYILTTINQTLTKSCECYMGQTASMSPIFKFQNDFLRNENMSNLMAMCRVPFFVNVTLCKLLYTLGILYKWDTCFIMTFYAHDSWRIYTTIPYSLPIHNMHSVK